MFKSYKIYIQISRDKVTAINLDSGEKSIKQAEEPFSSARQIIGSFNHADATVRAAVKELGVKQTFSRIKILIQQTEGTEGGMSDIEKRALRYLAELAGANKVLLVDHERTIPIHEALHLIETEK
jgi:hypothetical protein